MTSGEGVVTRKWRPWQRTVVQLEEDKNNFARQSHSETYSTVSGRRTVTSMEMKRKPVLHLASLLSWSSRERTAQPSMMI